MTGKYIEFTDSNGRIIKTKKLFVEVIDLNKYRVELLIDKRKEGSFTYNNIVWTFKTIYGNPEERQYIPYTPSEDNKPTGKPGTYTKIVGNTELLISSYNERLISSRYVNVSETCQV